MGVRASSMVAKERLAIWLLKDSIAQQNKKNNGQPHGRSRVHDTRLNNHRDQVRSAVSEPSLNHTGISSSASTSASSSRTCRHINKSRSRPRSAKSQRFGYQITDLDEFLTRASIEKPANIPVVLSTNCLLYQTQVGGQQEEVALPLGMVVNAVFKNLDWLYVQTPHGEEGYVRYGCCMPLGILPPSQDDLSAPCWESHSDIFPQPSGKARPVSRLAPASECNYIACSEKNFDSLYLQAMAARQENIERQSKVLSRRQTLLVVSEDYSGEGGSTVPVSKGQVVALVHSNVPNWFWIKTRAGEEGFIPAHVANNGFL